MRKPTPLGSDANQNQPRITIAGAEQCETTNELARSILLLGETMKTLTVLAVLLLFAAIGQSETLTAAQAKAHEGENATVCGIVASEHTAMRSRGEPTFINLDSAYPNQVFTIMVWGDDKVNVGALPRMGGHACATGLIKDYRGVPEIVVRSGEQLSR
jgi:hypothetical protein